VPVKTITALVKLLADAVKKNLIVLPVGFILF
jgi:hypothetical protein